MKRFFVVLLSLFPLISCAEVKYNVTLIGHNHCSFEKTDDVASRGRDYKVKAILDRGYDLLGGDILVTVKEIEIPAGFYSYDANTDTITVKGEVVTGNIKIEAYGDYKESHLYFHIGSGYDSPGDFQWDINIAHPPIDFNVVPSKGKSVNPNITVSSSDGPISPSKYSFTKHEEDNSYTFLMDDHREFYHDINVVVPDAI